MRVMKPSTVGFGTLPITVLWSTSYGLRRDRAVAVGEVL